MFQTKKTLKKRIVSQSKELEEVKCKNSRLDYELERARHLIEDLQVDLDYEKRMNGASDFCDEVNRYICLTCEHAIFILKDAKTLPIGCDLKIKCSDYKKTCSMAYAEKDYFAKCVDRR